MYWVRLWLGSLPSALDECCTRLELPNQRMALHPEMKVDTDYIDG